MGYQLSSDQLTLLICRLSVEEEEDETVVRSFPKMCAFSVEVMGQELIFLSTSGLCFYCRFPLLNDLDLFSS